MLVHKPAHVRKRLVVARARDVIVITRRKRASAVVATVTLGNGLAAVLAVTGLTAVVTSTGRRAVIATTRRRAAVAVIARRTSGVDAELVASQLGTFDPVESTLVVVTVVVLDHTFVGAGGIDVGKSDGAVLATNILDVLPAGVGRKVGDDAAELATTETGLAAGRRSTTTVAGGRSVSTVAAAASATSTVRVASVASGLAATLAALCVLDQNALAHEVLAVKVLDGVFGVTRVLELDEAERAHNTDIVKAL